jgi:hypothetical protein
MSQRPQPGENKDCCAVPQIFERHLSAWGVVLLLMLMLLLWPHKPRAGETAVLPTQSIVWPL